jgi:hypothetical protein
LLDPYRKAAQRWGAKYFFDKGRQIPEMLQVLRQRCLRSPGVTDAAT